MVDKLKVINFLQDFDCASLNQLQILYDEPKNNFKNVLTGNLVSKKGNIFVHNTKKINDAMLVALDILCKYKGRYLTFYRENYPVSISFLSKENLLYHIIVADEENKRGIIALINSPSSLPEADRLILAFPSREEIENINCEIPFLYTTYPGLEIINSE